MNIRDKIRELAELYSTNLKQRTDDRMKEMEEDDNSHYLIYRVLGVTDREGKLIDLYQNKGRFLYKYAGSFLEQAAVLCFQSKFPSAQSLRIPNTEGRRPKTFEIDCVINNDAIEIKWRDATTDGDHITKEHTRLKAVSNAGFTPIRVMFYYPNRSQAIRIQQTIETLYQGLDGHYHYGDAAWEYIKSRTNVDLKAILEEIGEERTNANDN
ncbi:MAG: ApaLI family restriction endonuclease [Planctomycetes bacterium]|nr:ApaLI family restriction endonuclease [Planctomycetota bacterium]